MEDGCHKESIIKEPYVTLVATHVLDVELEDNYGTRHRAYNNMIGSASMMRASTEDTRRCVTAEALCSDKEN